VLELEQDRLEELGRDLLRLGQLVAFDRPAVSAGRQLGRGTHRVVGLG
jgi:hypothetical protein